MLVPGPTGSNIEAFSETMKTFDGLSASLNYYFDSNNQRYSRIPGEYTITLQATDASGNMSSKQFNVTVSLYRFDNPPYFTDISPPPDSIYFQELSYSGLGIRIFWTFC